MDAFNTTRVELAGYEADDLIATYANFFDKKMECGNSVFR